MSLVPILNLRFNLKDYSPAHGEPGAQQLHDAAELLKGTPQLAPIEPAPEGAEF